MTDPSFQRFEGLLKRDDGGFLLETMNNSYYRLSLRRTPVDLIEKYVTVTGTLIDAGSIEVTGIRLNQ